MQLFDQLDFSRVPTRVYPSDLLGWDRAELLSLAFIIIVLAGIACLFVRWRRGG